jgi:hypothetical protein
MVLLIIALGTGFALLTVSFLELRTACNQLQPGYINALPDDAPRRISMEPELPSYPKGTKEINFIISDPSGLGFASDYYYLITKESYLFYVWPTRISEIFKGRHSDYTDLTRFGTEPSENNEPITMTYTLKLSDWSWQPTRGTYTFTTAINVLTDGMSKEYMLSCQFIIE